MLSCHLPDHRGVVGSRYARVCSDLGLRERAAQAVVKLVQRGALGGSKRREGDRTTGVECDTAGAACSAFESLWSEPFLPCSARSESWLLHTSTSASRRNDWYEATLLFEAVALQWFSLAFVQSHDALVQSVNALQRVIELGFYLEEASRRLGAVLLRQRQRDAGK